jgi:serine/threonine protein kinase
MPQSQSRGQSTHSRLIFGNWDVFCTGQLPPPSPSPLFVDDPPSRLSLLCGHFPFSYKFESRHDLLAGKFRHTEEWNALSPSAKSLISSLLQVDPLHRLSLEEILHHPWVLGDQSHASSQPMGRQYVSRLQKLTESERIYHDLKDEEGFISRDKILLALNLITSGGSSTHSTPSVEEGEERRIPPEVILAEEEGANGTLAPSGATNGSAEYDEESLEELLTQVSNCSNDPMNRETFVHFYIMSTLTLIKKRRRSDHETGDH